MKVIGITRKWASVGARLIKLKACFLMIKGSDTARLKDCKTVEFCLKRWHAGIFIRLKAIFVKYVHVLTRSNRIIR